MQQKGSTGDTLMPMAPDRSVSIAASAASTASSVSQSWNHQNRRLRTEDTDPAKAIEAHSQRKGLATKTNPEMVLQPVATRCNPLQLQLLAITITMTSSNGALLSPSLLGCTRKCSTGARNRKGSTHSKELKESCRLETLQVSFMQNEVFRLRSVPELLHAIHLQHREILWRAPCTE